MQRPSMQGKTISRWDVGTNVVGRQYLLRSAIEGHSVPRELLGDSLSM